MTKLLAVLCLSLALSVVSSQSCDYTANLRDYYGFSNTLTTAKTYSDVKYCNDIKSGAVCCTDTDINSIAQISADYVSNLTTLVSTRDLYLKNVKDNVLPNLISNINKFNTVAQQFAANFENEMANVNQDLGSEYDYSGSEYWGSDNWGSDYSGSDYYGSDYYGSDYYGSDYSGSDYSGDTGMSSTDILDYFTAITNMTYSFVNNINTIKANYGNYQTDRRTCVIEMMNLQNAALCLSCDPSAQDKGFTDFGDDEFGFNMADSVCQRLQTNCKPYLAAAVGQNQLIEAVYASALISGLTTAMEDFNNGNYDTALIDFMAVLNDTSSMSTTDDAIALIDASLPVDCDTNGDCEWICDGLFMNGLVDPIALIVGGEYDIYSVDGGSGFRRRRLSENRRLDTGEWAPAEDESGVTVTFAVDPANTNPSSSNKFGSLNLGNIMIGMMVVISSILLL